MSYESKIFANFINIIILKIVNWNMKDYPGLRYGKCFDF